MINNLWNTKNDWLACYNLDEGPIVNNYTLHTDCPRSLSDALTTQARVIYEDFKHRDIVISVSGGIDSQQAAYGFANANLPVKYVYFKTSLNGRPEKEQIYVEEFAKKYDIPITIIERDYTTDEVKSLVKKYGFLKNEIITAPWMMFDIVYKEYQDQNPNSIFVNATLIFAFLRDKNLCSGAILSDRGTFNEITDPKLRIPFNFYSSHLWQYYEYIHRQEPLLQFHKRFQPKNLAFTELGFPLREKVGVCEWFTDSFHEPASRTRIDFALAVSLVPNIRINFLKHFFGYSETQARKLLSTVDSTYTKEDIRVDLYSFETDVDRYDL
jgi:hypothetical protein